MSTDKDKFCNRGPADLPSWSTCITIAARVTAKTMVDIKGPGVITGFGRGIHFDDVTFSDVKQVTSTANFLASW